MVNDRAEKAGGNGELGLQPSGGQEDQSLLPAPGWFQLKAVITALLIWYLLSILAKAQAADLDLWGYLAFGRQFWNTGRFSYQDVFTYLPTQPIWVYHEWLTGVLYYPLYLWGGGTVLQLLRVVLALGTVGLLAATARLRGADFWGIVVMVLTSNDLLASGYAPVRAQVFSFFFFALTLYLLEACRLDQRWGRLSGLVPVFVLWANLHGGFLAGLGLLGIYASGEFLGRRRWRPYALVLLLAGLATLINPYGWHYWTYLFQALTMPRPEIVEWASVIQAWTEGIYRYNVAYLAVLLVFAVCLFYLTRPLDLTANLALGVTLILGLRHIRHLSFFYLLLGSYLAPLLTEYFQAGSQRPRIEALGHWLFPGRKQPGFWGAVAVGVVLLLQLWWYPPWRLTVPDKPAKQGDPFYYPVGAVAWLKQQDWQGNLLTTFNWGEFLLWSLYPQFKVALDGRYETVYPEAVHRQYMDFIFARPGWEKFLAAYPPDLILLERSAPIGKLLLRRQDWRQIYEDEVCQILVRTDWPPALKTAGRY